LHPAVNDSASYTVNLAGLRHEVFET